MPKQPHPMITNSLHQMKYPVPKQARPTITNSLQLHLLISLVILASTHMPALAFAAISNDCQSLLDFKQMLSNGASQPVLSSWDSAVSCCIWQGIICDNQPPYRVLSLNLTSIGLLGPISPSLANLTFLEALDLSDNKLHGTIPPVLGSLRMLQVLYLNMNSLEGEIPETLGQLPELQGIDLAKNQLRGAIPTSLFNCTKLVYLSLSYNNLTGGIPPAIGNLSFLANLYLGFNNLGGIIPTDIHRLANLWNLNLLFNQFSGTVPPELFNFSSLAFLGFGGNNLSGLLPMDLGNYLPRLEAIYLYSNHFIGRFPTSITNASTLLELDLSNNSFSGNVPQNLGSLVNLVKLHIADNQLESQGPLDWSFIESMSSCARLKDIDLSHNKFSGQLPDYIGNLSSSLQWLRLRYNQITGKLPEGIGNLVGLVNFDIENNLLSGPIPNTIGNLLNTEALILSHNMLSGDIPPSLGNLEHMREFYLNNNSLNGSIPASFASLTKLKVMDISQNRFNDVIPRGAVGASSLLTKLNLSRNAFVGSLPSEVGKLRNLLALDASHNRFAGEIPSSLGDCQILEHLNLQENFINGTIPRQLNNLRALQFLDLSQNQLYGFIPNFLEALPSLQFLNLSFNNFEGQVPTGGVFSNLSLFSVVGNEKLCGGDPKLNLKSCSGEKLGLSKPVLAVILLLAVLILIVFLLLMLYLRKRLMTKHRADIYERVDCWSDQLLKLSYNDLKHATDGFSAVNLIGTGGCGSVYKGVLKDEREVVAIKVFKQEILAASKSFIDECKVLRSVRHRNLVRILTACSTVDSHGDDFKALVYEFMRNGSLHEWLHMKERYRGSNISKEWDLNLLQRLDIAIDVGSGIDYLHNQMDTPIVHCDLKPKNVLLDDDMTARICDFGISRILPPDSELLTTGIKGTIGYMPPESAMGCPITTSWDVYSFGVLLLEMFTGKMPTEMEDGLTLHGFVKKNFPDHIENIIDEKLLFAEEIYGEISERTSKCLVSVIEVALICSEAQPKQRAEIRDALKKLEDAKKFILRV